MTIPGLRNLNHLCTHPVHSLSWDVEGQRDVFSLKGNGGFAWKEGRHREVSLLGTAIRSVEGHASLRHWRRGYRDADS